MPNDSPSQGSRRHFHRGRRGHERRGGDRRGPQGPQPSPAQPPAEPGSRGDHVDVEQIMREIRAKIAQRPGIELTDQQVQELAARRLESILDLRGVKPGLLDQLRKAAGARPDSVAAADRSTPPYEFEDTTIYESPNAVTRFFRKLLQPLLKLFFNPNPLIRALHLQSRFNADLVKREAERDTRQAEWNALHYELLQRVVTEASRATLELQSLALRIESLAAKVDFNERRVRGIEGVVHQPRPSGGRDRDREAPPRERDREREREREPAPQPVAVVAPEPAAAIREAAPADAAVPAPGGDAPRRRRRRRRGRRGGAGAEAPAGTTPAALAEPAGDSTETEDEDVGGPDEREEEAETAVVPDAIAIAEAVAIADTPTVSEPALLPEPAQPAPERVTPQLATAEPSAREETAPGLPEPAPAAAPAYSDSEPREPQ